MARTAEMPTAIHSDVDASVVAEPLLQHYNVGCTNPWYDAGLSSQETYTRRKLPWAGKEYNVDENGNVSGVTGDANAIHENMKDAWRNLASASRDILGGNEYDDLKDLYGDLQEVGDRLEN